MFVLDANVFIEAARRYYALDLVPGFWKALVDHAKDRKVESIDRVKDELLRGRDELSDWSKNKFDKYFKSSETDDVVEVFGEMLSWVMNNTQFLEAAKAEFAGEADGWIIAYAKVNNLTVVTHEVYDPNIKRKVPMPNICEQFDVPYVNTFDLMRTLGIKLK